MPQRLLLLWILSWAWATAQDEPAAPPAESPTPVPEDRTVEDLTRTSLESVVVIYHEGRKPGEGATGSGFVIDPDGLIATNWHVINDRRRIEVELHDGTTRPVVSVHAWDRKLDLALVQIEPDPENPLSALELGDSDKLVQGQSVIALGNPRGLKFSVVEGVVGALRDDIREGPFPMIQVSMPVEQGNSGGPLLDRQGKVHGIISLKSMVTANLGFATPINALQLLLEKPNSMPIDRWATIGALDERQWNPTMGAQWSQRAGRIQVSGTGDGFGGRSLCLSKQDVPAKSYEVEVQVKLDDEAGAAGLAFSSDGGEKHYGFYPSGGRLRLTRFDGPNVYTWEILEQLDVESYKMGDWNRLRVRVEPNLITCFVNDVEVARTKDATLRGGSVGLCKFRGTEAEFRHFRLGDKISPQEIDPELRKEYFGKIEGYLRGDSEISREELLSTIVGKPNEATLSLEDADMILRQRLEHLEQLRRDVQAELIGRQINEVLHPKEGPINLLEACLLIARVENQELDVASYVNLLDQMGLEIREALQEGASEKDIIDAVRKFMFEENGFHASRLDYYNASNSFLNEVIDDREGIPITLSVLFIELARRAGSTTIHGVGLPGHFVVAYEPKPEKTQILDAYEGAKPLSRMQAMQMVAEMTGELLNDDHMTPVPEREVVLRMLRNLIHIKKGPDPYSPAPMQNPGEGNPVAAMPYLHVVLQIDPENVSARFDRALLRFQEGDREGAKTDIRWLLQNEPPGIDLRRLRDFYESM